MSVRSSCSSTEARVPAHTVTPNFWHRKLVDNTQPNKAIAGTSHAAAAAAPSAATTTVTSLFRPDLAAMLSSGAAHTTLDTAASQSRAVQAEAGGVAAPRPAELTVPAPAASHRHRRRGGGHSKAMSAAESSNSNSTARSAAGVPHTTVAAATSFMVCAAPAASSEAPNASSHTAVPGAQLLGPACEAATTTVSTTTTSLTLDTQPSSCTAGLTTVTATVAAAEAQDSRGANEEAARVEEVKQAVVHKHAKNTSITKVKGPASIEELRALRNRTIPLPSSSPAVGGGGGSGSGGSNATGAAAAGAALAGPAQASAEENEVIEEISKLLLHYCVGRDRKRVDHAGTKTTVTAPGPGLIFPKPSSLPSSLAPLDSGMPSGPHRVLQPNKQPHRTMNIVLPGNAASASQASSTTAGKSLDVAHWPTLEEAAAAAKAGRQHRSAHSSSSGLSTPSPAQRANSAEDSARAGSGGDEAAVQSPEPAPAIAAEAANRPAIASQPTRSASSSHSTTAAATGAGAAVGGAAANAAASSPSPKATATTSTTTTTATTPGSLPMPSSASHAEDDEDDPVAQELELYSQLVRLYQTKKVTLSTLTLVHEMLLHTRVIPHMSNASGFAGQPHNNSVTSRRRSYLQQLIMVLLNEMMQQKYKEECQRSAAANHGDTNAAPPLHPPLPIHPPVLPIPSRAAHGPHTTMPVMPSSTLPPALLGATPSIHIGPRPHNGPSPAPMWGTPAANGAPPGPKQSQRRNTYSNSNSNNNNNNGSYSESNNTSFVPSAVSTLQACGQPPYPPMMMMPNALFMPPAPMWPPFAAAPTGGPMPPMTGGAEPQSCTTVFPRQVVGPVSMNSNGNNNSRGLSRPAVHTLRSDAIAPPPSGMTFHPLTGMLAAPLCAEGPHYNLQILAARPTKAAKPRPDTDAASEASDEMDEEEDEVQDLLKFINEQAAAEARKGFTSCPPTPAESPSQQRIPSTPEGITPTVNITQAERIILRTVQLDFKERARQQGAASTDVAPLSLPPSAAGMAEATTTATAPTSNAAEEILFDFDAERAEVTRPIFDSPVETCEDADPAAITATTTTAAEAAAATASTAAAAADGKEMGQQQQAPHDEQQQPSFHFAEAAAQEDAAASRTAAEGSPQEESTCRALLFAEKEAAETRVVEAESATRTTSHAETSVSRQAESTAMESAALGPCESGVIGQGRREAATLPLSMDAQPLLELGRMDFRPALATPTATAAPPPPSAPPGAGVGSDAFVLALVPARPPRHHNRGGRSRRRGRPRAELFAAPRMRVPSATTALNTNAAPFVPVSNSAAAAPPFEPSPRPHATVHTTVSRRAVGSTLNRDAAPFVPMHMPPMEPPMAMPYFL